MFVKRTFHAYFLPHREKKLSKRAAGRFSFLPRRQSSLQGKRSISRLTAVVYGVGDRNPVTGNFVTLSARRRRYVFANTQSYRILFHNRMIPGRTFAGIDPTTADNRNFRRLPFVL